MPTFNDLIGKSGGSVNQTSDQWVSFNSIFGKSDDEIKKMLAEQARQNKIAQAQAEAAALNAQVQKNTAANQSLLDQVKRFGPAAAKDAVTNAAKSAGESLISLPKEAAKRVASNFDMFTGPTNSQQGLPGGADIAKLQQKADQQLTPDLKDKTSKIMAADGVQLLQMVKEGKSNKEIGDFLNQAVARKQAEDKKTLAAAVEAGGYAASLAGVFGAGSAAKTAVEAAAPAARGAAVKAATGDILTAGAGGATGNVATTLRTNPNASFNDVIKAGLIGGGTGIAAGALGTAFGSALKKSKANQAEIAATFEDRTAPVTDNSRLIPAVTDSRKLEVTDRLNAIDQRLGEIKSGAVDNTTFKEGLPTGEGTTPLATTNPPLTKGGQPDLRTGAAKRQGTVTPSNSTAQTTSGIEVRNLVQERKTLQAELDNMNKPTATARLDDVERRIAEIQQGKSSTPTEARALMQERQGILQEIQNTGNAATKKQAADINAVASHASRATTNQGDFVPRVAQRTEAKAVANGLAGPEGFDNLPTAQRLNLENQANTAVDLVNNDPETAKAIAMGKVQPPDGVQATAVYKAVEANAVKKGDAETIRALTTESTIPKQATQAGQFNAALNTNDPESPVDIIRKINSIRGKSQNANVSKFVTPGESDQITTMAAEVAQKKDAAISALADPNISPDASRAARLEYGRARVALDNYQNALTADATKRTARQVIQQEGVVGALNSGIQTIGGTAKALRATFDNSAIGRQGLKTLLTHPTVWARNSVKSFGDLLKQGFTNKEVLDELKADIISRPNALNGMYKRLGVDVLDTTEEAFPQHLPEQIWGLRRPIKASDAAYTGFVQRSRADLADMYINIARKSGVNLADKAQTQSIGKMVNALTGRGYLTHEHNLLNNVFFSPKLLKSHIDVLTAHQFQHGVTPFVRKQAAINTLKIISGMATVLAIADQVRPGSAGKDARSADFGKIRVGDTRFDVTGGMAALATLAWRMKTMSTKSSVTGDVKSLTNGGFNSSTAYDVVQNFFENKLAPAPGLVVDLLKGKHFDGQNTRTPGYVGKNLFVPLSYTNFQELQKDPNSANKLLASIADGLGISTNTYGAKQADWRTSTSQQIEQFKRSVPEQQFLQANDKYNQQYADWQKSMATNQRFQALSADDRATVRTNKQNEIRNNVFKDYGFTYKQEKKPNLKGF